MKPSEIPLTSEAAGYPSKDWEKTADRLFECSRKLELENARLRAHLDTIRFHLRRDDHTGPDGSRCTREIIGAIDRALANT